MAYTTVSKRSGKTYHLHSKQVTLRGGHKQTIYYFAGSAGSDAIDNLPGGYQVVENPRTGLPLLKKSVPRAAIRSGFLADEYGTYDSERRQLLCGDRARNAWYS